MLALGSKAVRKSLESWNMPIAYEKTALPTITPPEGAANINGNTKTQTPKKQEHQENSIKNYEIMWRRDSVFWGRGSNRGVLEGRRSGEIIDFREQIGVYVLYDEGRRPVYVGQAGQGNARLFKRLRAHRRDSLAHRWHYFSWFGLLPVNMSGRLQGGTRRRSA